MNQLHDMETFAPLVARNISKKDSTEALEYLMILAEKRYVSIKLQKYAEGRKMSINNKI